MRKTFKFFLLMTILPWLTVPFIGTKSFKRFLPGSIFMVLYLIVEGLIAQKRKWWWFPFSIKPNVLGELPLIIGPFFVGSLWIFKYTFGNFKLYLKVNLAIDSIFSFLIIDWFKKIGYVTLVRFNKFHLSFIFLIKSIVMYYFQYLYERYASRQQSPNSE